MEYRSMQIRVADIPWSPKQYHFARSMQWLDDVLELYGYEAEIASELAVDAEGYRFSDSVHFTVSVSCHLKATCARCLKEFDYELSGAFRALFKPEVFGSFDESDDELATAHIVGGEVDLEPLVAEFLKLQIPMRFLCSEDCKGLCPVCGEDRNLGPCRCEREAEHR